LFGAAASFRTQIAELFQQGQGRVDDARAGAVHASEFFLDRLHQLVTVARFFGDQLQQHIAQVAVIEDTAMTPASAMTAEAPAAKAEPETASRMAPLAMPMSMFKHYKPFVVKPPRPSSASQRLASFTPSAP